MDESGSRKYIPPSPPDVDDDLAESAGGRRRLVEIRCGFAELARREADMLAVRAGDMKARYAEQMDVVARAEAAAAVGSTQAAKEEAHRKYRSVATVSRTHTQIETAAGEWLEAINRINAQARLVESSLTRERATANALRVQLVESMERAESGATMADEAMAACQAAEAALEADRGGSEVEATEVLGPMRVANTSAAASDAAAPLALSVAPAPLPDESQSSEWLVIDIRSPEPQVITRLLRRDGHVMGALVDRIAGTDVAARSCWQLLLSNFVDAIVGTAIEDAALELDTTNEFWSQFTPDEACAVAHGLAALGFRFDGLGSFAGGRIPARRDLAMAVGSAGLFPVRVRHWPEPEDAAFLFRGARAAADTFIASEAPALTLGELVRLLGRRAEPLADLWNEWDRIRPLLFATTL
jgi:hypothetical protein